MRRSFTQEAVFQVEDELINGSGAGRPLGVIASDATIEVAKESGQPASTVVAANLKNMAHRLWSASHANGVWLMGNDAYAQIADAQFANGVPIVTTGANGHQYILGLPLVLSEYTAALGTVGDIVLADMSQYLVGEEAPNFISSIHVRFIYHEGVFRFRWRVDGQPAWKSPVTPKNSATTQSPFVMLAERA